MVDSDTSMFIIRNNIVDWNGKSEYLRVGKKIGIYLV